MISSASNGGRRWLAMAIMALVFAAYHVQLGRFGVANALVFALFAAAVRQRWLGNLWYAISFHALVNLVTLYRNNGDEAPRHL